MNWKTIAIILLSGLVFAACTTDKKATDTDIPASSGTLVATSVINVGDATQCDGNGGFTVDWGIDENKNGVLDAEEVDGTGVVCNGAAGTSGGIGADGLGYLVATSTEATGTANCSGLGGLKIDGGVDLDNDQTLDAGEIATTAYVCNGDTGAAGAAGEAGLVGATSLLNVSSEPAGANCPAGGIKVEAGVDTSADGNLDAGEVSSTSYVCSVASVISTTDLPGTKGASTTLTGSISVTDPVWRRSDSCGSSPLAGNFFYDAHYLTNATASAQAYSINATWSGVAANGFLHVYDYPFDTLLQGSNCLGANDDLAGDTTQSQVNSIMLRPGQTIVVVASTFSAADVVSSYDITVSNTTPSMPAFGDQLTLTGALTEGSRTWYHDLGCYTNSGTPDYKYETHMIVNDSGVDQFLYAYATFSTDGYLYVYIDGFNPNDQGANCEFSRDDGYDTDNSYGMVVVPAGSYAIFVVSTYSSSELMDYDLYLSSSYFGYNFEAVYGGAYGHTMELTPGTDDGSPILWNLSDQRSSDGAYSFRYAIPSAGNYDTGAPISGYLETYPFYVWAETAKFSFDYYLDNECPLGQTCAMDTLQVMISTNGVDWTELQSLANNANAAGDFSRVTIDLSSYWNNMVQFRFLFTADNLNNAFEGAYIDNIQFIGIESGGF